MITASYDDTKFSVSLYSISHLAFLMETSRVLCDVRNERLYKMLNDFGLQKINACVRMLLVTPEFTSRL